MMKEEKQREDLKFLIHMANTKTEDPIGAEFLDRLKELLNVLIRHKKIVDCEALSYLTKTAHEISKDYSHVWQMLDGKLEKSLRKEQSLNAARDMFYHIWPLDWSGLILDLLKNLPEGELPRIKKCQHCGDFFYAENLRREVCYPPKDCQAKRKREYQKRWMSERRDPDSPTFDSKYVS
jgi:hypothetical protein